MSRRIYTGTNCAREGVGIVLLVRVLFAFGRCASVVRLVGWPSGV
jgi:hypothetical protein